MTVDYYMDTMREPPMLLRQVRDHTGLREEAFRDGQWRHTNAIAEYQAGENNFVDRITEQHARNLEPAAFR